MLAGLLAGIIATATEVAVSVLLIMLALVLGFLNAGGDVASLNVSLVVLSLSSSLIVPYLLLLVVTLIVRAVAGLGLGALGGVIGKLFYEPDEEELQEMPMATYYPINYAAEPPRMYRPNLGQPFEEDYYEDYRDK